MLCMSELKYRKEPKEDPLSEKFTISITKHTKQRIQAIKLGTKIDVVQMLRDAMLQALDEIDAIRGSRRLDG